MIIMRMMLVGAGAVGESILKILQFRDPDAEWLEFVLVCDNDGEASKEVARLLQKEEKALHHLRNMFIH